MNTSSIDRLIKESSEYDNENRVIATMDDIRSFEKEICNIPEDYKRYLLTAGYMTVGSEYFDRLHELRKHIPDYIAGAQKGLYSKTNVFVFSWDPGGNPVFIDNDDGKIYCEDHNFGGIHCEANSLSEYIEKLLDNSVAFRKEEDECSNIDRLSLINEIDEVRGKSSESCTCYGCENMAVLGMKICSKCWVEKNDDWQSIKNGLTSR